MCIAILAPAGKVLDKKVLNICYINNSDGCGFGFSNLEKGIVEVFKTMDFEIFYKEYLQKVKENPNSPFIIHFRIRTSGTTDEFNCHPFIINNQQCFIHNGVIHKVKDDPEKKMNDTQMFNELVLKRLPIGWEQNVAIRNLLEEYIVMSKICVLNADGSYYFLNESKGEWKDGIWWSNKSYEEKVVVKQYNEYTPHRYYGCGRRNPSFATESVFGMRDEIINRHTSKAVGAYNAFRSGVTVCDICGTEENSMFIKSVNVQNTKYSACRDCIKMLNSAEVFYYEYYDGFIDEYEEDIKFLTEN